MKAEAKAGELHLAHIGSKGVDYAFDATKTPSTWAREHSSQYIEQYNIQLQKFGQGNFYEQSVDGIVDVYAQQLSS
jgi:hypothetical protein